MQQAWIWIAAGMLTVAGLAVAAALVVASVTLRMTRPVTFDAIWTPGAFGLTAERITLTSDDGLDLVAHIVLPPTPKAVVIFLSGIHQPSVTGFFGHARWLLDHGYASLLLEMRAHGDSEGDRIGLGILEVRDVQAAVRHLKRDPATADLPIVAFGWSMGGAAAISAAGRTPEIEAVIALAAFSSWSDVFVDVARGTVGPLAPLLRPFVDLHLRRTYGPDARELAPVQQIRALGDRPALLMHARGDPGVPVASLQRLRAAAPPQVQTWVRESDEHMVVAPERFHTPQEDRAYAERIVSFLAGAVAARPMHPSR